MLLATIGGTPNALANSFNIRPIYFVNSPAYSMVATGTITTLADTGSITDWNLTVTTTQQLAHYSPANTVNMSAGEIVGDGQTLTVATSPDGSQDGGSMFFRAPNPFSDVGVAPANFAGLGISGGEAVYMYGGAFDFLGLNQPDNTNYVVAQAGAPGGHVFELTPLSFGGGVVLSGTITTDGTLGPLGPNNIRNWDIDIDQVTQDLFNRGNSTLLQNLRSPSADGLTLNVLNPDGFITFSKGFAGGRMYALQLADFSSQSPAGGQAGYFQGRLAVNTIALRAQDGPWAITGTELITAFIPEPSTLALLGLGFPVLARSGLRRSNAQ